MSKLQVFDPPVCCSTSVCGPQVDPALARFSADLDWLRRNGVEVERRNLSQEPAAFAGNVTVAQAMRERDDALPLLLVDGTVVARGSYPDRAVLAGWFGLTAPALGPTEAEACRGGRARPRWRSAGGRRRAGSAAELSGT